MAFKPDTATLEELRALPAPGFFERDTTKIKKRLVAKFEAETGRPYMRAKLKCISSKR